MKRNIIPTVIIGLGLSLMLGACGKDTVPEETPAPQPAIVISSKPKKQEVKEDQGKTNPWEEKNDSMGMEKDPEAESESWEERPRYESYDEVIGMLEKGDAYAYVELLECGYPVLLVSNAPYKYGQEGELAADSFHIYATNHMEQVVEYGDYHSGGRDYPVSVTENYIYMAGPDYYQKIYVDDLNESITEAEKIERSAGGNGSDQYKYYSFSDFIEGDADDAEGKAIMDRLKTEYDEATVLVFNPVE